MKKIVVGTLFVVLATWVLFPGLGLTTAEIAKKENSAPCAKCHVKPLKGDENLNDCGKIYKDKKDLKACEPAK